MNPTAPQHRLDELFTLSTLNPAHIPEFLRLLMQSELLVLGVKTITPEPSPPTQIGGGWALKPHTENVTMSLTRSKDGKSEIFCFTSPAMLRAYFKVRPGQGHAVVPAYILFEKFQTLFTAQGGYTVVLNPGLKHGRVYRFSQDAVAELLADRPSLNRERPAAVPVDVTLAILLRQIVYPALSSALTTLFAKFPVVETAWLVEVMIKDSTQPPVLTIALAMDATQGDSGWMQISADTVLVASQVVTMAPVDLINARDPGVSKYFAHGAKPFYRR